MSQHTINGTSREYAGDPDMPLLWYLRDELGLTGSKFGCGAGLCGACTVHVDGAAVRSCVTPMKAVEGKAVVTIEGLQHKVQAAWREANVPQCGYCQSGQIMSAAALLARRRRRPTRTSTRRCAATSAAAAPTSASARRSRRRQG